MNSEKTTSLVFGGVFLFLGLLLIGFAAYLKFGILSGLEKQINAEKKSLESIQLQQTSLLSPEVREVFERYSRGILAVEVLFSARENVFSGTFDEEKYEPVVMLDIPRFFEIFQKLLKKDVLISNFSIDPVGRISFLAQTISYSSAADQIAVFQFGAEKPPQLLTDLNISHIAKKDLIGKTEDLPEFLANQNAVYSFAVQAKINAEYFIPLQEQAL